MDPNIPNSAIPIQNQAPQNVQVPQPINQGAMPSQNAGIQVPQTPQVSTVPTNIVYASFWRRLGALVIDTVILEVVAFVLSLFFGSSTKGSGSVGFNLSGTPAIILQIVFLAYSVLFTSKFGKTLGKMALKIKVVDPTTNLPPKFGKAIMREVIGKFVSSIAIGFGYLWVLWDAKKQGWHDKIAKTIVIKE